MPIFHVYFDLFFDMYFFVIEIPCKDVKVWAERHNFLVYRKTSIKGTYNGLQTYLQK